MKQKVFIVALQKKDYSFEGKSGVSYKVSFQSDKTKLPVLCRCSAEAYVRLLPFVQKEAEVELEITDNGVKVL